MGPCGEIHKHFLPEEIRLRFHLDIRSTICTMAQYIEKALAVPELLTITEFIKVVEYPIDTFMIDRFWNTMNEDKLIYVDMDLIDWMGFTGEDRNKKHSFMRIVENSGEYLYKSNSEYSEFILGLSSSNAIYPPAASGRGVVNTKHLLLTPDCLRAVMMRVNTQRGDQVRAYYISLEKLFKSYIQYQNSFREIQMRVQLERDQKLLLESARVVTEKEKLLLESAQTIAAKEKEIADRDKQLANTRVVNGNLLAYKLFLTREETLYIITSKFYAAQGLFKVGKTKMNAKDRVSTMNTGHVSADSLFIAGEFRTNNSKHLEDRVHHLMQHHRDAADREWFHLPYRIIVDIINKLNENHIAKQDAMNEITRMLHELKCKDPKLIDWTAGMPLLLEGPEGSAAENHTTPQEVPFDYAVGEFTNTETRDRIVNSLGDYLQSLGGRKPSWTTMRKHLSVLLKQYTKKPKLSAARDQIIGLCRANGVAIK